MRHPINFAGNYYDDTWAGYKFKSLLGYTSGVHTGVDYNGPGAGNADLGMEVAAATSGTVVYAADRSDIGFGRTLILESTDMPPGVVGKKLYQRYMHLNAFNVTSGQKVVEGQVIGWLGNSGTKYAHLHLDIWTDRNGLGVHLEYHKDTQLSSYEDPFVLIDKNKNWNGGIEMFQSIEEVKEAYLQMRGVVGTSEEMRPWVGQSKQRWIQLSKAETDSTRAQLAEIKQALANEQAKPPREVIKEVVKIVEKPIEVIKEVLVEVPVTTPVLPTDDGTTSLLKTTLPKLVEIVKSMVEFLTRRNKQ